MPNNEQPSQVPGNLHYGKVFSEELAHTDSQLNRNQAAVYKEGIALVTNSSRQTPNEQHHDIAISLQSAPSQSHQAIEPLQPLYYNSNFVACDSAPRRKRQVRRRSVGLVETSLFVLLYSFNVNWCLPLKINIYLTL